MHCCKFLPFVLYFQYPCYWHIAKNTLSRTHVFAMHLFFGRSKCNMKKKVVVTDGLVMLFCMRVHGCALLNLVADLSSF